MRSAVLALLAAVAMCMMTGCAGNALDLFADPPVRAVTVEKGSGLFRPTIAIVDVSGVLHAGGRGEGLFAQDSSVVALADKLASAKRDSSIKALILRVDTPGGGVTASDIMYQDILRYKQETGVPVYVAMQSLCASGGYYLSMAADEIYAHPTTITGSIGVIAVFPEGRGLMDKLGLEMNAITSGPMKDSGSPYRRMRPEDRALYQDLVDDFYSRFLSIVAANRTKVDPAELASLADGRVYTAKQAAENGLIDGLMSLDEVVEHARVKLGKDAKVVLLERSTAQSFDSLYARGAVPEVNVLKVDAGMWAEPSAEVFQYLWHP